MKNRKPISRLKPIILVYNGAMVAFSAYFCYGFARRSYLGGGYNLLCQGINFEARDKATLELLDFCWWYLWVRVADFLDTVFFVLRRKDSHVSFLHVGHHCLVVFDGWYGLGYGADGQILLGLCLNSFVHVIMYSYYFLSLLGSCVQKYLWWKRYLTQVQIGQFFVLMAHGVIPLFIDCGYPRLHILLGIPQGVFFISMFLNFYWKAYRQRITKQSKKR